MYSARRTDCVRTRPAQLPFCSTRRLTIFAKNIRQSRSSVESSCISLGRSMTVRIGRDIPLGLFRRHSMSDASGTRFSLSQIEYSSVNSLLSRARCNDDWIPSAVRFHVSRDTSRDLSRCGCRSCDFRSARIVGSAAVLGRETEEQRPLRKMSAERTRGRTLIPLRLCYSIHCETTRGLRSRS